MHNFKVGDEVIVKDIPIGEHPNPEGGLINFTREMYDLIGKISHVDSVINDRVFIRDKHDIPWAFLPEWLQDGDFTGRFDLTSSKHIEKANDQFAIIQDGKIDIEKLKDCLICGQEYLAVFADGGMSIHRFGSGDLLIDLPNRGGDSLNALYKERKQKEIDKNSIQEQIKKLEEDFEKNVAELRKKLV